MKISVLSPFSKKTISGVIAVAGYGPEGSKFEMVRVDEWRFNESCPNLPNLPFPADLSVGAHFRGKISICGGIVQIATRQV